MHTFTIEPAFFSLQYLSSLCCIYSLECIYTLWLYLLYAFAVVPLISQVFLTGMGRMDLPASHTYTHMQYYLVAFLCTHPSLNSVSLTLVTRIIYMFSDEIQAVYCCNSFFPLLEMYYTIIPRLAFPFLQLQSVILSVIKIS